MMRIVEFVLVLLGIGAYFSGDTSAAIFLTVIAVYLRVLTPTGYSKRERGDRGTAFEGIGMNTPPRPFIHKAHKREGTQ